MEITTNLGYSFSKLEDLVRYMEEENITEVILGASYFGAIIPGAKTHINTIKKIINNKSKSIK